MHLLEDLIPKVGIGAMIGSSDSGKSAFWRQCALHIITGKEDFLGFKISNDNKAVYFVSTEDDINATSILLKKQLKGLNIPDEIFENLIFTFETEDVLKHLEKALSMKPASLIILDAYGDLLKGKDGNQGSQVREILKEYDEFAKRHNCFILFIHHIGKRTEELNPSKHHAVGSQSFEAKMRLVIQLSHDAAGRKILTIVKGNYISTDRKNTSTVLEFDENNLSFALTEETVPINTSKAEKGNKRKRQVDWSNLFGAAMELKRKDILDRLWEQQKIPKGTASSYITSDLEQVEGKVGFYRIPK